MSTTQSCVDPALSREQPCSEGKALILYSCTLLRQCQPPPSPDPGRGDHRPSARVQHIWVSGPKRACLASTFRPGLVRRAWVAKRQDAASLPSHGPVLIGARARHLLGKSAVSSFSALALLCFIHAGRCGDEIPLVATWSDIVSNHRVDPITMEYSSRVLARSYDTLCPTTSLARSCLLLGPSGMR